MSQCKNVFEAILRYGHDEDFVPQEDEKFSPRMPRLAVPTKLRCSAAELSWDSHCGTPPTVWITAVSPEQSDLASRALRVDRMKYPAANGSQGFFLRFDITRTAATMHHRNTAFLVDSKLAPWDTRVHA